ncbi:low temperature requirement protein A [Deinococcus navajonensis]|uniref:Low temperature requirement protein A n=1 Tax=Deinococcus navajonensis TaxID=309884 RepID=A0ABV8XTC4_9DEIO
MTHGQPDTLDLQDPGQAAFSTAPLAEQKVTWLELFFDLIFVVAFDQLSKRLGDSPGLENIAEFGLMFTAVWWAWAGNTMLAARYGNETRAYQWGTVAQLISMAMLALTLRGDLHDTGFAFALAYFANRALQVVMDLAIGQELPGGAPFARRTGLAVLVVALAWLISVWLPPGSTVQIGVWCAALLVDLLIPVVVQRRLGSDLGSLPHGEHLPERIGLLQIIAMGAIVTEVVGGSRQQALSFVTLFPALSAIVLTVGLWRLYFDQARTLPLLGAHLQGQLSRMLAWLYAHLPFTLSIIVLGVGLGHGISAVDAKKDAVNQQFVAWPLSAALLTLVFLRWNSKRVTGRRGPDRSLLAMWAGALAAAALGFLDLDTGQLHGLAAALTVVVSLVVATDPVTRRLGQIEEKVTEQLSEDSATDDADQPGSARTDATSANPPTNSDTRNS